MRITRRHLLALAAAVPVAGAVGAGLTALRWWDRPPGEGLTWLSPEEYALVQALGEAWMPPGGEPSVSGAEANVGAFFDETVGGLGAIERSLMKALLQALDDATLLTHAASFRTLPLETRSEVLAGWLHAEQPLFRSAVQSVLVLVGLGYTLHPDVVGTLRPHFGCVYGP